MSVRLDQNYSGGQVKAIKRELRERRRIGAIQELYEARMSSADRLADKRAHARLRAMRIPTASFRSHRLRSASRGEKYPGQWARYLIGAWRPKAAA
jgi:hypothetical protein